MTTGSSEQAAVECLTGITSMATRHVLAELAASFERRTGQCVALESVGGVDAVRRIEAGDAFDFVVLAAQAIDRLAVSGRIDPLSRVDIARSPIAIAVRTGSRHPGLDGEQAVRDALLAARSIGHSTGPSGRHLARLLERWGIADIVSPRTVEASPGVPVGTLLARGDVEIGLQQLSELIHVAGIDVAGVLPPEIQEITVFSGAVCASTPRSAPARAFLEYCASPEADAAKHANGMQA